MYQFDADIYLIATVVEDDTAVGFDAIVVAELEYADLDNSITTEVVSKMVVVATGNVVVVVVAVVT